MGLEDGTWVVRLGQKYLDTHTALTNMALFSGTWGRDGCGAGMPLSLYLCDRHEDRDCKISLGYTVILGHGGAGRSVSLRPAWLTASSRTARAA